MGDFPQDQFPTLGWSGKFCLISLGCEWGHFVWGKAQGWVGFGPCEVDPSVGLNQVKPTPKGFTQHKNCHSFLFVNVHHIGSGNLFFGVNFYIFSILGI